MEKLYCLALAIVKTGVLLATLVIIASSIDKVVHDTSGAVLLLPPILVVIYSFYSDTKRYRECKRVK